MGSKLTFLLYDLDPGVIQQDPSDGIRNFAKKYETLFCMFLAHPSPKLWQLLIFLSLYGWFLAHESYAETQYVRLVQVLEWSAAQSEDLQALEFRLKSLGLEIESRDLALSPQLTTRYHEGWDQRETFSSGTRSRTRLVDLTLTQPFSTGTELSLEAGYELARLLTGTTGDRHIADWTVSISQNLWRDFFGRSTRLRRTAETHELKARQFELAFQKQQFLVEVETIYWNLAFALHELEVRKSNLKRSQQIEQWVRSRLARSAAEPVDLLQAQALVANRDLQLETLQDDLLKAWARIKQVLPVTAEFGKWLPDSTELRSSRNYRDLLAQIANVPHSTGSYPPIRLDALAHTYLMRQKKAEAQRIDDELKPDLKLTYSHGRNGIEPRAHDAFAEARGASNRYDSVAIILSTPLDFDLKNRRRRSAQLEAQSTELTSQRLFRESSVDWKDLDRELTALMSRIKTAEKLFDFQSRKSQLEQRRYQQGRSTAFQAITFEQEAAEAELQLLQLYARLRKTEARARLFAFYPTLNTSEESAP